jgi:malonyl-CoA/methylmalonyl-CoA synthetase
VNVRASGNLFEALGAAFPADLDEIAIEPVDRAIPAVSFRKLEADSARLANCIESLNLPRDARVLVHTEKSVQALALYLAVLRTGLIYVPLNPAYRAAEIEHFVRDAAPSLIVCSRKTEGAMQREGGGAQVFSLDDDGTGTLIDRAAGASDRHRSAARAAEDLAAILYTSGTTGRSKGAMLTHGNLLANALTLKEYWGWRRGDVLIHALPLFHTHGLFVAAHGAMLNGSKMIWFNRFEAGAVVAALPRATLFMGVPTLYVRMLQESTLTHEACRHMRLFLAGSAPLLPETFDSWRQRTGHTILERYGMSETVMLTSNPYRPEDGERLPGSVGFPLPGVALRVTDDRGKACEPGTIGGIEVKGPSVFRGYWRAPELTAAEFSADGWFRTGDVGTVDAAGYVRIVGRSKDLIISGGFNVYPAEVEGYLNELPGVAESAVIGVPHPDFGEAVVAVIATRAGAAPAADALLQALRSKIASFKVPKRLILVEELPRNAMGKVQKALLREQHKGLFA